MRSIAEWHLALSEVSFDQVGSLHFNESGRLYIGPRVTLQAVQNDHPFFPGPFETAKEHYLASIDRTIGSLSEGTSRWNPGEALQTYLLYARARELVSECREMEQGPWYVQHAEPKGDHILFDEDWKVTGVIDWEW